MARPGPATQAKRARERLRNERHQEKAEKRALRKEQKKERTRLIEDGHDPDLDGIKHGPQPIAEDIEP